MKYISLIEMMRFYGEYIIEQHVIRVLDYSLVQKHFDTGALFKPFEIKTVTEDNDGSSQIINVINQNYDLRLGSYIVDCEMPSILEIAWLKDEMNLTNDYVDVLNQLSYLFIFYIITWMDHEQSGEWMALLEDANVIIEVEDLKDTPSIVQTRPLQAVALPKYKLYASVLLYTASFYSLFDCCKEQSMSTKELYFHMPVLLAMFMSELRHNKLKLWPKRNRLDTENKLKAQIENLKSFNAVTSDRYTYGMSSSMTSNDINFMLFIISYIYNKLHDLNTNIGLILYQDYIRFEGPEIINASVRLSDMKIDWDYEIAKAEREKDEPEENILSQGE